MMWMPTRLNFGEGSTGGREIDKRTRSATSTVTSTPSCPGLIVRTLRAHKPRRCKSINPFDFQAPTQAKNQWGVDGAYPAPAPLLGQGEHHPGSARPHPRPAPRSSFRPQPGLPQWAPRKKRRPGFACHHQACRLRNQSVGYRCAEGVSIDATR
jgi:hypothetical protein